MKRLFVAVLAVLLLAACAVPLARINGNQRTVKVFLDVEPASAKVYLDGIYIGRAKKFSAAKGGLDLTAGVHLVRFEAEGYLAELIEVITADGMPPIEVRMLIKPGE